MNNSFRKLFLFFFILFPLMLLGQNEEKKYKEYSYTEFFEMIENERDSIFKLRNAIIKYTPATDSIFSTKRSYIAFLEPLRKDTIVISKQIELNNVQFTPLSYIEHETFDDYTIAGFNHIKFLKKLSFNNTYCAIFNHCTFEEGIEVNNLNGDLILNYLDSLAVIKKPGLTFYQQEFIIQNSILKNTLNLNLSNISNYDHRFEIRNSIISSKIKDEKQLEVFNYTSNSSNHFNITNCPSIEFENNIIENIVYLNINNLKHVNLKGNTFSNYTFLEFKGIPAQKLIFSKNSFQKHPNLKFDNLDICEYWDWSQWNILINSVNFNDFTSSKYMVDIKNPTQFDSIKKINEYTLEELISEYNSEYLASDKKIFISEKKFLASFLDYYRSLNDTENENLVYIQKKNLETNRYKYLYLQNSNFDSYFTWKINEFLKLFSAYGTKPSKAIIFSLWVIFFFAFIYLLFPNSWDTLGKKRLMHRFDFFQKYLRRREGMHTLYLEHHEKELSSYEEFKNNLEQAEMELPKFFIAWSKPLYNASMFSSRITSKLLKKTDVLKGKWKDLSPKQKRWKNLQIGFLLTLGLLFDFTIKVLNALMLSINTFTTLGFGEIPIKGIPRYLAILQGFIGWFMLTIFSVSLISQLLN